MEQRHGREHTVARAEHGVGGNDLLAEGIEVQVREQDALGGAGGAAGIEDGSGVIALTADLIVPEAGLAETHELVPADDGSIFRDLLYLAPLGEHIAGLHGTGELIADAGDDDVYDAGVLADGLELAVELVKGDDGNALGLIYIELKLLLAGEGVNHVRDGADHVDGIEHIDGLRAVRHGDGDLVVCSDAEGAQAAGALLYICDEILISGGAPHEIEGDIVWILLGNLFNRFDHRALKIIQRGGNIAKTVEPRSFCCDLHN